MKKLLIPIFLLTIFFSFSVSADYSKVSGENNDFSFTGNGNFNSDLVTFGTKSKNVITPGLLPLIADLDNDTVKEIVILDANTLEIYRGSNLNFVDSINFLNFSSTQEPSVILFDIDGDDFKEIIATSQNSNQIEIYEYNGTDLFLQVTFQNIGGTCFSDGIFQDPILTCRGVNDCLMTTLPTDVAALSHQSYRACSFNSTAFRDRQSNAVFGYNALDRHCLTHPSIPRIEIADYDDDGTEEYIMSVHSYLRSVSSGNGNTFTFYYDVDTTTGIITKEQHHATVEVQYSGPEPSYSAFDCDLFDTYFTSPTTADFDESSPGLETIIGFTDDSNSFIMESFDSTGTRISRHPDFGSFDPVGSLVSNIMIFKAFPVSKVPDFCVMGFEVELQRLSLLCSSFDSGTIFNDDQVFEIFLSDWNPGYNISQDFRSYNRISHAGQHDQTITSGLDLFTPYSSNLDELIMSYGVFRLEYDFLIVENLLLEFENPVGDSAVISEDAENIGLEDLIILSESKLVYLDDLLINQQAFFDGIFEIDPCVEQPIKLNTTMKLSFTIKDPELDNVNFTAFIYYGHPNQQVFSEIKTPNINGADFVTGLFPINQTIVNGDIRIEARDTNDENQAEPDILNFKFTVTSDGVEYLGGCVTSGFIEGVPPTDPETIDNLNLTEADIEDIAEAIAPSGLIPVKFRPLYALLILVICILGTLWGLVSFNIRDSGVLIYIPLTVGLIVWLFLVFFRMIAGWTVIVAIILASAFIGSRFIPMGRGT